VSTGLTEPTYRLYKQTTDIFSAGLKTTGYSPDQCDMMTHCFMKILLENPTSAQEFIKSFIAIPKPANSPKHKRK
jgi:hypothetical protein